MGRFRHPADQRIPPQHGNSAGADFYGGNSQIQDVNNTGLYGRIENGKRIYNLDAQVAVTYLTDARLQEDRPFRTMGPNSYLDEIAQRHDVVCWYAADTRDRMLRDNPAYARPGRPGEYLTWDELSVVQQSTGVAAQAQQRYKDIRNQAELDFNEGLLRWQPESQLGKEYRAIGKAGFQYLPGTYGQANYEKMLGQLPRWRDLDADAIVSPPQMFKAMGYSQQVLGTNYEQFVTQPMTDRERGWFHPNLQSLQDHGPSVWEPHPNHPADQPGAMEHGRFVLQYTDAQGRAVDKVLDMDNNRRFTITVRDPHTQQVLEQETFTPTGPLVKDNHYTPTYRVEKTNAHGQVIASHNLPAGKSDYPSADTAMYREAKQVLGMRFENLRKNDDKGTIGKVQKDMDTQAIQSQQLYLRKDHPLHREPQRYTPPQLPQTLQPEPPAHQPQPATPAISPTSSTSDMFKALVTSIGNQDAQGASAATQAYAASAQGQAFLQAGRDQNQAVAQQQAQQQAEQQRQDMAQPQQRGPVMRM